MMSNENNLAKMSRFQRAQGEAFYDFVELMKRRQKINDDDILNFIENYSSQYSMTGPRQDLLISVFESSARDFISNLGTEDLNTYLVFKTETEEEKASMLLEEDMIDESPTETIELPENILTILEQHETMNELVESLQKLTIESPLAEIGTRFGYEQTDEFLAIMKRDLQGQLPQEQHEKIDQLELKTTFEEYATSVLNANPEVALDSMRMDFVRTINAIIGG
jgi:hypothetical protein